MNNAASKLQTLKQVAKRVSIICRYGAVTPWDKQSDWQQKANGWNCTLRYRGRQFTFDFWQGSAITGEPTVSGTLSCLLSDAQYGESSFEDFCAELGYDTDSRRAEAHWKACEKIAVNLKRLLGSDYETFLYAERD